MANKFPRHNDIYTNIKTNLPQDYDQSVQQQPQSGFLWWVIKE